jgi:hypothetical protein
MNALDIFRRVDTWYLRLQRRELRQQGHRRELAKKSLRSNAIRNFRYHKLIIGCLFHTLRLPASRTMACPIVFHPRRIALY